MEIKELKKAEIMALLTEYVLNIRRDMELFEKCPKMFVGLQTGKEIFLTEKGFDKAVEILQPVVTFDPNWGTTDTLKNRMEAYFFFEIMGEKYKVFCLKDKEVKHV